MKKKLSILMVALVGLAAFAGLRRASTPDLEPTAFDEGWVETAFGDLATNDVVVIVDKYNEKAMSNDKGTSAAPAATAVTFNDGKTQLTGDVPANIQWTVTVGESGIQFGADEKTYLYCTNSNNGVRVGSNASNVFTWELGGSTSNYFLKNTSTSRWIGVYNGSDWRCYTSVNTNINKTVTAFYKKTMVPVPVARPVFSVPGGVYTKAQSVALSAQPDDAEIYYTLDGTEPTASSTKYENPIEVSVETTIKAIAIKGEDKSKVATATYTFVESIANTENTAYTIAEAINLIDTKSDDVLSHPDNKVYVKGIVSKVDSYDSKDKAITYWISADGLTTSQQFEVYAGKGLAGTDFASIDDVTICASVIGFGNIKKYTPKEGDPIYEFDKGNVLAQYTSPFPADAVWSGVFKEWTEGVPVEASKFASLKAGDNLEIGVVKILEAGGDINVMTGTKQLIWTDKEGVATITVTGAMAEAIKKDGLTINVQKMAAYIRIAANETPASETSVWIGEQVITGSWSGGAMFDKNIFNFAPAVAGKVLKLKAHEPAAGARANRALADIVVELKKSPSWAEYEGHVYGTAVADGYEFALTDAIAEEINANGFVIQASGSITITEVDLEDPAPVAEDVEISPVSGDIAAALATASEGKLVKDIIINLTKDVTYTVSAALVAPNSITINGNGATIDASALAGNFIEMAVVEAPTEWTEANLTISGITVKGLKMALFYSACKNYFGNVSVDNCVVEQAADATTFDYTKGSTAVNFTVTNSTFYAPAATTKSFYSSQSGQKTTEYNAEAVQTFTFTNNTMYNLAPTKNFFTHRQANQKWLAYNVKNNIFVNCGKSGQVIKGMNGGQGGANPTWAIDGNVFNFDGADTSAAEDTGDTEEPVKNSIAGVITFLEAENGDFNAVLGMALAPTEPTTAVGDPRWTVANQQVPVDVVISPADGDIAAALATASEGKLVKDIIINLTKDVTYTVSAALVAPNSITINGNGAIIDASALDANLIEWKTKAAEDTEWTEANVAITAVTVKGLKKALFFSNSKFYYGNFSLINSVIEQAGDATTFDYTKGSTALNFTVAGSTIYAPTATTKSLYSSQGGQKATEYNSDATQNFVFSVNTMYNLAKSKNFFTHRQSNQKWLSYTVQYNIFVNCGKSGQVIKGMNGGQGGANPTWAIKGNVFNFDGADTSAGESTGDEAEPVQESVAGVVTFTDAAAGDFNGSLLLAPETTSIPEALGDARWTLSTVASYAITKAATEHGTFAVKVADAEVTYAAAETAVAIIATPDADYEVDAVTVKDADEGDVTVEKILGQDNAYQFTMPAKAVTVTVTFKEKGGTGIKVVEADALENAVIYNMQGVRVEKAEKGLYIVNGRKVVIK